ncbi:DNA-binding beta-propeller fold protein YncE [Candidatus Methanophagaceae archaeon]|nr:DNA-binding beta-propeller fold protein YncE [Methanophagales archaeon]
MSKSYWLKDQKGNFSNAKEDTFDPEKRYVGIRLQQGVPLLDRDWNELEDIRRYEELMLRKWYVGNGTPDDGYKISVVEPPACDFKIAAGRCIVDGFEVVNDKEICYTDQVDVKPLSAGTDRQDIVYLDVWIEEVTSAEDPALKNSQDVNVPTCERHKLEWRVRIDEESKGKENHLYYDLAEILRKDGLIIEVKDLRTTKLTLASVREELEGLRTLKLPLDELDYIRLATVNRWIKGGEVDYERSEDVYKLVISDMVCIIRGQELDFVNAESREEIKGGENCVIVARANGANIQPEIEFIVTRANLMDWLNSWALDKWMPAKVAGYTEPVLKSSFTLPLYFLERPSEAEGLKKTDFRHHGVLDTWLAELAGRLDSRERRMCRVPLLQQTIFGRTVPVANIPVGKYPYGIGFDGAYIWVVHYGENSVSKINIHTNLVEAEVTVGENPRGVAFDGAHVWVTNSGDHSVSKINVLTNEVITTVSVGENPRGIIFDDTYIWVVNFDDNSVNKIDIRTNKVVATAPVGKDPRGVAFDGTHIWVANFNDHTVSKINTLTNKLAATISVGKNPRRVAFDGAHIWVANSGADTVSKINIHTNEVIKTLTVGGNPRGVAFDGAHIWVVNFNDHSISKMDIVTNKVVATVRVGKDPRGVAFDGRHLWVANSGDNSVSKILRGDLR